jgi:hypothetical protein
MSNAEERKAAFDAARARAREGTEEFRGYFKALSPTERDIILEDSDLDAMTDEQLHEELGNWRTGSEDDPFAWEVDGNYRLVERHIELRGMSEAALSAGVAEADGAIERWTPDLDGEDAWLARRIIRNYEADAKDFRREQARRKLLAGREEADDAEFDGVIVMPEGIFLFPSRVPADMALRVGRPNRLHARQSPIFRVAEGKGGRVGRDVPGSRARGA